jgi:acyl carrier protein
MSTDTTAEVLLTYLHEELALLDPDALLTDMRLDSELASLGLDSITMVSAVAAIEARYSIRIPDGRLARLKTVGQFISLVQSAIAKGRGEVRDNTRSS